MRIKYYCGLTKGYKNTTDGLIEVECSCEGERELTESEIEDWNNNFFAMDCPKCGGRLVQDYDDFEIIGY